MHSAPSPPQHRGVTLIETVIAIGVLAVALPLVFGALASSGDSVASARAETRAAWVLPICMEEIRASRSGTPRYFAATTTGQEFPPSGNVWAIAFAEDGTPIDDIPKNSYDRGIAKLGSTPVRYIATISAKTTPPAAGQTQPANPLLTATITFEYPASAPAKERTVLTSYTRIP